MLGSSFPGSKTFNVGGKFVRTKDVLRGDETSHPAEKPIKLRPYITQRLQKSLKLTGFIWLLSFQAYINSKNY